MPRAAGRHPIYAVLLDGAPIGTAECRGEAPEDGSLGPDAGQLGYWLGEPYLGRGYASEGAAALVAHTFDNGDVTAIRPVVSVGSEASLTGQRKLGFEVVDTIQVMCRPQGRELPLVRTRLARAGFTPVTPH